jgi:hypothetical protein
MAPDGAGEGGDGRGEHARHRRTRRDQGESQVQLDGAQDREQGQGLHEARHVEETVRTVAIDEASLERCGHRDRHEVDARGGAGQREVAQGFAQEHEHGEAHHAHGHPRQEGDDQQAGDVGLADELDVFSGDAVHGNS